MVSVNITHYFQIVCFWLIFIRWSSVVFQLPIFDNVSIPIVIKTLFSLILSYAFYPLLKNQVARDILHLGIENFWALSIFYLITGLVMGYLSKVLLNLFTSAGSIINQQVGFGFVHYFDPTSNSQIGPFEKLIYWTTVTMIISSGALLPMFKGVYLSFFEIHLDSLDKLESFSAFFLEIFKEMFLASLMLASPLIFTHLLIMTVLGIIARTIPQMNIIMVSLVVNIGLGLLVFIINSNDFFYVAFRIYTEKLGQWFQLIT